MLLGLHFAVVERTKGCSKAKGGESNMSIHVYPLQPMAALIAGILILIRPKLLNYIVAIYLILIGIIGLTH
jgi:hypothetical protein